MKNLFLIGTFSLIMLSCGTQNVDQQAEAKILLDLSREWSKSAGTDSLEKVLSYWSDDAVCLFPDQAPIKGKEGIRNMLKGTSSIPGFEVSWEPKEAYVSTSGDLAYVTAQNYFKMLDSLGNTITTFNKGIEIWKKQLDGSWKCIVDIYNSDPSIKSIR